MQTDKSDFPLIEVFIVNYKGGQKLVDCVASIMASDYPSFKITIIENKSADSAIERIKKEFPDVRIIEPPRNVGYAGAMEIAVRNCNGSLIIMCNNDLWFDATCISRLAKMRRDTSASAVSARIINPNESEREKNTNATLNPLFHLIPGVFKDRTKAVYPSGACFLIKKSDLSECLPPEGFFLYYEDVYLGMALRMRRREIVQANDAVVHHDHGYSVKGMEKGRLTFFRERNRYSCIRIFFSPPVASRLMTLALLLIPFRFFQLAASGKSGWGCISGWFHAAFSNRYIRYLRKRHCNTERKMEDVAIEMFTGRMAADDHKLAKFINSFGKFLFELIDVKTMD